MHANPGVIKLLEERLVSVATAVESSVDDELHRLDNLTEDDLETVRQKRLDQMKRMAAKRQEWLARGHGTYREVNGEKEFFTEMKGEERMVCHFYRGNNTACKVIDVHLEKLCAMHVETKFIRIDAEKSPFLVERLKIWMLPTLALIKQEKTVDYVVGLDELGGSDDFKTDTLRARLAAAGVLNWEGAGGGRHHAPPPQRSVRAGARGPDDEDSDFDD